MIGLRQLLPLLLLVTYTAALPLPSFGFPSWSWFSRRAKPTVCNGRAEFCDRKYSDITFIGSHDSFAFSTSPFELGRDQTIDITKQLEMGVRLLQAQSHEDDGVLKFCHTNCVIFDGGSVEDYLKTVKTFLDKNPNEVLTVLFTNPEGKDVKDDWKPIFDKTGMSDLAFTSPNITPENPFLKASDWPTLGEMIESGKRVVVFLDAGADIAKVNFLLPEFKMIWETPFSVTDEKFPCKIDRIDGPLSADDHMFMINHSLNVNILPGIGDGVIVSDPVRAGETNGVASITAHVEGCKQFSAGRKPNFILIDFVGKGEAFKAADILNGFA